MGKFKWGARAGLLALMGLLASLDAPAQQPGKGKGKSTLKSEVAKAAKQKEEDVQKVLDALGPVVTARLRAGEGVDLPGLGAFRVVRVAAHRDLVNGRPALIPAANYIEFVPSEKLNAVANTPGVEPSSVVPGFEFVPIPGQTPGGKVPSTRTQSRSGRS